MKREDGVLGISSFGAQEMASVPSLREESEALDSWGTNAVVCHPSKGPFSTKEP